MAAKKSAKNTPESTPAQAKPAAKKAAKVAKKAVAKKATATATATATAPAAPTEPAPAKGPIVRKSISKPSLDEIARAAYLNYRRRVEQGLPGDSQDDWLEAERQFADPS